MIFSSRKLMLAVLGPIGALTIVGTGFAFWTFNEVHEETVEIGKSEQNVIVTDEVTNGRFKFITHPSFLVFSRGELGASNLCDGITFYTEKEVDLPGETAGYKNLTTMESDSTLSFRYVFDDPKFSSETESGMKLNIGIGLDLITQDDSNPDYLMENFLEISSDFKNQEHGYHEATNGEGSYFFLTEDRDYAQTSLHFNIVENESTTAPGYLESIEYSVALNQFVRYENSDVKPSTQESYQRISEASKNGKWQFKVRLIAYFTDLTGDTI